MADLSVLIPARNEAWLNRTVVDVLDHAKGDTEVIVVLDGELPDEELNDHPRLNVVVLPTSIGQRAATNLAARIAQSRYVMKLDAHCAVADGFDVELMKAAENLGPLVTQIPSQRNLHVYDQVCDTCRTRHDQAPSLPVCPTCQGTLRHEAVWQPRRGSTTTCWSFDAEPRFQYGGVAQPQVGDICDVMSSLGACFFMTRDRFFEIGGLDESHGSWGNFGIEIACKSWLSGGRHVVNKRTWFAHFFRVGGIKVPWPMRWHEQQRARDYSRRLWFNDAWPGQVLPLRWLVDKFWPVKGWTEAQRDALPSTLARRPAVVAVEAPAEAEDGLGDGLVVSAVLGDATAVVSGSQAAEPAPAAAAAPGTRTSGVIYYSDNRPDPAILEACRRQLKVAAAGRPIVSVTLGAPVDLGTNIVVSAQPGYLTMARQILTALEWLEADVVFFCEHDLLYHPSHFDFEPSDGQTYFYNQNTWKVDAATGRAVHYRCEQLSGLCVDRALAVDHFRRRVAQIERSGFSRRMGFEPGKPIKRGGLDDYPRATWMSAAPNIDIRHDRNLTRSRWSPEEFRDQRYCQGWTEADAVPGWGPTRGRFDALIAALPVGGAA